MVRWMRSLHVAVLGAALLSAASCGGSSSSSEDGTESGMGGAGGSSGGVGGSSGGTGGSTGGTGGSKGGSAGSGAACLYNGVRYEPGQTFGDCDNCVCDEVLGVSCKMLACPSSGGSSGSAGTGGAPGGCDVDGKHVDEGASWASDCNTCYCKGSQVVCTEKACASGGTGGAGGKGGTAGAGAIGAGGEAGSAPACEYAPIGSFCIVGKPTADGQELVEGMPLTVSLRPDGCYSSSCTKLVSVDCNYLGSDFVYYVSGFVCLATEGDVCTDDCGGGGNPVCEPGVTLTAGTYEVGIGGTSLAVKFSVPSEFAEGELCAGL